MKIQDFEDVASITALARPGPLNSGGTTQFIKRRVGDAPTEYMHPMTEEITKVTFGVVVYQEHGDDHSQRCWQVKLGRCISIKKGNVQILW